MKKPLPVPGYTDQSEAAIALVSENKILEEIVLRQIDKHMRAPLCNHIDQQRVAQARETLILAFMVLNRAIFKPTRIVGELPEAQAIVGDLL